MLGYQFCMNELQYFGTHDMIADPADPRRAKFRLVPVSGKKQQGQKLNCNMQNVNAWTFASPASLCTSGTFAVPPRRSRPEWENKWYNRMVHILNKQLNKHIQSQLNIISALLQGCPGPPFLKAHGGQLL